MKRKKKVDCDEQVLKIFRKLAGTRADRLCPTIPNTKAKLTIADALKKEFPVQTARDIAFHLVDWNCEAAFIVAMQLFPERFTKAQIRHGVALFIAHAPNHTAAAAKLAGYPVEDIFEINAV